MNNTLEETYIKALSKGDQKAFEALFLFYQPKLVNFLSGMIKDTELARDLAQNIFMDIWNNKEKTSEIKSFKAFIFKMGKNAICNYFDHLEVNQKFLTKQLSQPTCINQIEEEVYAHQLEQMVDTAVNKMPAQRKLVYTMSRVNGIPNDEIAKKLKIDKRTVENHLTSALSDIRKILKGSIVFLLFFF